MVVERAAEAAEAATTQVNHILDSFTNEVQRTLQRIGKSPVLLGLNDPPVGATPKDTIFRTGTLRLSRYRPVQDEVYRVPVVLVMSLIAKPYILDLTPGQSLVEFLLREGFDVFMIDWGVPRPEDKKLKLEDYILDFMPRCLAEVQRTTGEADFSILGYCMGGLFALMYGGIFHDAPLRNIVCAATPVDMEGMGLFRKWLDPRFFDVDRFIDNAGNVHPELILRSFEMLRPVERWFSYFRFWDNLDNDIFVYGWRVWYKWVEDQIPFPGEAYRQMVKELMWDNKLMKGELTIGGRLVETQRITCPLLHVMAEYDHIAPFAATRPLSSLVGSTDKEDLILKGGHVSLVAGRNANQRFWPMLSRWLGERSV